MHGGDEDAAYLFMEYIIIIHIFIEILSSRETSQLVMSDSVNAQFFIDVL
jgi:hypothetical protein